MGFSIVPKDTLTCRLEYPAFQLVDDMFYLLSYGYSQCWKEGIQMEY